jgi:hypothetical protein
MATTLGYFFKQLRSHVPAEEIQPAPVLSKIHKPQDSSDIPMGNPNDNDNHDHPGQQRVPTLSQPAQLSFQLPPILSQPADVLFQPAPPLSVPSDIPFTPAPPLSVPNDIPFTPAPPLSTPKDIPFTPAPPLSTPKDIPFTSAPPLSQPAVIPFQEAPALSITGAIPPFQNPPTLSQPSPTASLIPPVISTPASATIPYPGAQPTPDLLKPRPVDMSHESAGEFFDITGYAEEWKAAGERQLQFFKQEVPKIAQNMLNRAVPRPGNIDPDILPSTIATKGLAAVANKIHELENKYIYNPISDAGSYVSEKITSVTVNSAPEGAYVNSPRAASLELINQEGLKNPKLSLSDVFINKKNLNPLFAAMPKNDIKYVKMNRDSHNSKFWFDDSKGQLSDDFDVGTAAGSSYFPFYITDLRPTANGKYRTVFFKPFNLEIAESFAPNWNLQNFIGRVDPVATYQNTTRTLSLSFKMVAQHPNDLKVIYSKLGWLSSMVYPEYGANMRYRSGPVVRMRVGDLINARSSLIPDTKDRPGVTGIINSLDYTYAPIWEVEDNWQLSRDIDISLTFTVLHELPIGMLNGEFGTIGVIGDDGVYMTPQLALENKIAGANDQSPTTEKDYVDGRGFRRFGDDNE